MIKRVKDLQQSILSKADSLLDHSGPAISLEADSPRDLGKICKICSISLTTFNAAKAYKKSKTQKYRIICRKCRSKEIQLKAKNNPKRKAYILQYIRRKGIVKQYPCHICLKPHYKNYGRSFCSDKCRFLAYVDKQSNCWIWIGAKNHQGYGKLSFRGNKTAVASRVSYELFKGEIKDGLFVCHLCDVKSCVNPDHLWLGNHMENMIDMTEKGRQSSKLTPKDAMTIRALWEKGYSNAKLCEMFSITSGTVSSIIHRRIWKHV